MSKITPKQKEVLELISKGYSNRQIAIVLENSEHTINAIRKTLIKKYPVINSAHLVAYAIRMGIID